MDSSEVVDEEWFVAVPMAHARERRERVSLTD